MANTKIKPIRTEKDYEEALARIDALGPVDIHIDHRL